MTDYNISFPKVTVITVVLNRIESIRETIEDTLSQSYPNLEYIVIDGGSTDGTLEVIKSFSDKIIYKSEPDNGIYDAMMKGTRMATGKWIIFRNAGDYFYSCNTIKDVFSEYIDHGEDLIIGGVRNFVNNFYMDFFSRYPEVDFFTSIPAHHTSTFIRRTTQLSYPYPNCYKQDADIYFFMSVLNEGSTYFKFSKIISLFDNRKGATCDHYDVTIQERIKTFISFNAPQEHIDRLERILTHWQKVKRRRRFYLWNLFYKFTRWYYGYYKEKWHRYYDFREIFDNDLT